MPNTCNLRAAVAAAQRSLCPGREITRRLARGPTLPALARSSASSNSPNRFDFTLLQCICSNLLWPFQIGKFRHIWIPNKIWPLTEMKFLPTLDLDSIKPSFSVQNSAPRTAIADWISGIKKSSCAANENKFCVKNGDLCDYPRMRRPSDAGDEAVILNDLHSPRPHEAPSDFRGWYKLSLGCKYDGGLGSPVRGFGTSSIRDENS